MEFPQEEIYQKVIDSLEARGFVELDSKPIKLALRDVLDNLPEKEGLDQVKLEEWLIDRCLNFGPLTKYLNDETITEIMVNGLKSFYIEKKGRLFGLEPIFSNENEIIRVINRMASESGRRIDISNPSVDAKLKDGSRINAIIAPLSLIGPVLTIRRFPKHPPTLASLRVLGAFPEEVLAILTAAVNEKRNIVISGGTGSGKTTLLNALAGVISSHERIITIEDSAEMKIVHPHIISLEARQTNMEGKGEVTLRQLVRNALRMRPDRIIVGEVRGGEAMDMLQAMNTGHQGSLTTVHANSPLEALLRIETLGLMAELELPHRAIREQLRLAIDMVIQLDRQPDGSRRITDISRVDHEGRGEELKLIPIWSYIRSKE